MLKRLLLCYWQTRFAWWSFLALFQAVLPRRKPRVLSEPAGNLTPTSFATAQTRRFSFSVVTACFNTGRYLERYFKSLTRQRLDFKKHIEVICVDDGSTDHTAEVIKRWMKKYPKNIRYLCKENGGAASARNLGLQNASAPWVACLDSDDFVNARYFCNAYAVIRQHADVRLIICKPITFYEASRKMADRHPLSFRFSKSTTLLTLEKNTPFIHIVESSALLSSAVLHKHKISYKEDIQPTFEDGELMLWYMQAIEGFKIALVPDARYYAAKRSAGASLYTSALSHPGYYTASPENGMLRPLRQIGKNRGFVPKYVQNTLLFAVRNSLQRAGSSKISPDALEPGLGARFAATLRNIVRLIDTETILNPYMPKFEFLLKFIFMEIFKAEKLPYNVVTCERYDAERKLLLLSYPALSPDYRIHFYLNGKPLVPAHEKVCRLEYMPGLAYFEVLVWLPYAAETDTLSAVSPRPGQNIFWNEEQSTEVKTVEEISAPRTNARPESRPVRLCLKLLTSKIIAFPYKKAWLFTDQPLQADDNAEHMYRYVSKQHPDTPLFYLLDRSSPCWERLRQEGFNLLAYGSLKHLLALLNCRFFLSSQLGTQANQYLPWLSRWANFKFIYFGHGLMKNNLSKLFNANKIDCFTRMTLQEYAYITADRSPYRLTGNEVALTGLPRQDRLLELAKGTPEKIILFMPTWNHLYAQLPAGAKHRFYDDAFKESLCFTRIQTLLSSPRLACLLNRYGYSLRFIPHSSMRQYLRLFHCASPASAGTAEDFGGYQSVFAGARLLVTDYSSMDFDFALLRRPILYYQFDAEKIFDGTHTYTHDYYDYAQSGFGPVLREQDELLAELENILSADCAVPKKYLQRMNAAVMHRDGENCARVYDAIMRLTRPETVNSIQIQDKPVLKMTALKKTLTKTSNSKLKNSNRKLSHAAKPVPEIP